MLFEVINVLDLTLKGGAVIMDLAAFQVPLVSSALMSTTAVPLQAPACKQELPGAQGGGNAGLLSSSQRGELELARARADKAAAGKCSPCLAGAPLPGYNALQSKHMYMPTTHMVHAWPSNAGPKCSAGHDVTILSITN